MVRHHDHQGGVCGHLHVSFAGGARAKATLRFLDEAVVVNLTETARIAVPKGARRGVLSIDIRDRGRGLASTTLDVLGVLTGAVPAVRSKLKVYEREVAISVQYQPHGIEPRAGYVVRLEAFAAPGPFPDGPMVVEDDDIQSLPVVAWTEPTLVDVDRTEPWRCRARVHRNQLFVVDRDTWTTTDLANRAFDVARPVAATAAAVAGAASRLSWSSLSLLTTTFVRTTLAAAQARAFGDDIGVPSVKSV